MTLITWFLYFYSCGKHLSIRKCNSANSPKTNHMATVKFYVSIKSTAGIKSEKPTCGRHTGAKGSVAFIVHFWVTWYLQIACFQHFKILIPNASLNLFRIRFKEKNNECAICNCKKIYLYFQVSVTLINLLVCDQDFLKAKLNYLGCCYRTDFQTTSQNHCLNEKQLQASLQIKERK